MAHAPTLALTPSERLLCTLLDDTCVWMTRENPTVDIDGAVQTFMSLVNHPRQGALACEARIAGGWVRDKVRDCTGVGSPQLLLRPSHDLDVSLSSLTGHTFALFLQAYLGSGAFSLSPLARDIGSHSAQGESMSHIGRIAANPEQSKNLETATARVFGMDLDFVNLRKEEYIGDTRIPIMAFGTPKEDAERRDITINSLFYNVHTQCVEDWTGLGLADLHAGFVRTPLDPLTTFTDDPLRILRCIRFASRYGYTMDPAITACLTGRAHGATSEDVARAAAVQLHCSLTQKVSRERFGIEVDKMLTGAAPLRALELLADLGLYHAVLQPPPPYDARLHSESGAEKVMRSEGVALRAAAFLQAVLGGPADHQLAALAARLPESWLHALRAGEHAQQAARLVWYAVAFLPLRDVYVEEKNNKLVSAAEFTIAHGLKLGTKTTKEPVAHMYRAATLLHDPALARFPGLDERLFTRKSSIGLLVRHASVTNPALGLSLANTLLFALLCDLGRCWEGGSLHPPEAIVDEFAAFWAFAVDADLPARAAEKPLLDGNQITSLLQCEKPLIRRIQPHVIAWQLDHNEPAQPLDARQDACSAWLKDAWDAGHIVPVQERTGDAKASKRHKSAP
ncbi:CCA tRNA nucleotidyltransferase [Malassezia sp. CBS 17886]|nr:CCA tRNA nucleotidyltransferase [Malassezia sp. CBS 17886]